MNKKNIVLNNLRFSLGGSYYILAKFALKWKNEFRKCKKSKFSHKFSNYQKIIQDEIIQMVLSHRKYDENSKNGTQIVLRRQFHDVLTS